MLVIPAIDIKDGKVVRLLQGNFDRVKVYSNSPLEVAQNWIKQGAQCLHIVDLDGAEKGVPVNIRIIENLIKNVNIPVNVGGGIRDKEDIARLINSGASKIVLGTMPVRDRQFAKEIFASFIGKIIVSIDMRKGKIATDGWQTVEEEDPIKIIRELKEMGQDTFIYTDIISDGMLQGANVGGISNVLGSLKIKLIAAGGVSCLDDLRILKKLEAIGLIGVIIGKALYEGRFSIEEAISTVGTTHNL